MRKILNKRAQSTLEYAVLIGVIVAGLIGMQVYVKRGFEGKLRGNADNMGEQFSPGQTTYTYNTISRTSSNEDLQSEGKSTTTIKKQESNKTGTEHVETADKEYWWGK